MKQVVIENPVLNSPFREPTRHFRFTDEGITNEVEEGRQKSSYFVPITRPKNKEKQQSLFETEWTQDRIEENRFVKEVRRHVNFWRNRKAIRRLFLYKESIVFAAGWNNFRHKERIKYVSYV